MSFASHSNLQAPMDTAAKAAAAGSRGTGRRAVSSALVLLMLGGLAYWGHRTNWKLHELTAIFGSRPAVEDDWCKEHNVPESVCIECHPALVPASEDYG